MLRPTAARPGMPAAVTPSGTHRRNTMPQSPFFAAILAAAALAACSKSPAEHVSAAPAPPASSISEAIAPSARADVPAPAQPAAPEKQDEPSAAEKAEFERPVRK